MKRGFKVTLMTVAATVLGFQAMAMAPTIKDVPSPIVGSTSGSTDSTPWVFGDAINLTSSSVVSDDSTPNADLAWSYFIAGTPAYSINGVGMIDPADDAQIVNPGAKDIANNVLGGEINLDGKAETISVRNIRIAPLTGTGQAAGATGIIDTQVVTLFASDGTTYSSKDVFFYTDNGGEDRLEFSNPATAVKDVTFNGSTDGWTSSFKLNIGQMTFSTNGNSALCIQVPLTGGDMGGWVSPTSYVDLVDNAIYRFRLKMNFTAAGTADQPLWDLTIDNYGPTGFQNVYGASYLFFDNVGGANRINATTGSTVDVWWAPAAVSTPQWKAGAFTAANDAINDMRLQFRVTDADNSAATSQLDAGTVCLDQLTIDRFDVDKMQNAGGYVNSNLAANNVNLVQYQGTSATYASGKMTVKAPTSVAAGGEFATVSPGDANWTSSMLDDFPTVWESGVIYEAAADISAPTAADETNTWDVLYLNIDVPTYEVFVLNYMTADMGRVAMPKVTPATYRTFMWSGTKTLQVGLTNYDRVRPLIALGYNADLLGGGANTGSTTIANLKLSKVSE